MLDEPTDSSTPSEQETPPAKAPRRRRATKATAAPAETPTETSAQGATPAENAAVAPDAAPGAAEAATAEAGAAETGADEAPAPAKRVRKAPAKKAAAAPRKRTAKKPAEAEAVAETPVEVAPETPAEEVPLTEEELAAQAALLELGEPVVTPVEQDEAVAAAVAADTTTPAVTPSGDTAPEPAPAKRTRARRPVVVTFQAPEPVVADEPADQEAAAEQAPAPRRRRRAGTTGAVAPSDLVPQLLEPVQTAVSEGDEEEGAEEEPETDEGAEGAEAGDRPRRRRRGRRGRGPRRTDEDGEEGTDEEGGESAAEASDEDESAEAGEEGDGEGATGTRRRRRRRRSGAAAEDGDEPGVVTHVREPRARNRSGATSADEDGVRGISGSTRMAAKRVRRQEGRDSGRKRQPILSEAEFLARREAVDRTMVVRQKGDRTQIAVLEDGVLVEHYVTKASAQSYAGNVYLGRVQNVLPSMEAAFVDIGKSRNAVLYAGEVNYGSGGRAKSIESVLKSGQEVLVQVTKDPIGHKGARLTGQVSLPGRYLVYVPEGSMTGISRKLPEPERDRLKKILKKVVPDDAGVIIRTAAEGASEEEIAGDVRRLQAQWEVIKTKAEKGGAPTLLHAEPDLVIRVVRDVFNEDFTKLVVQGDSEWDTIRDYVEFVAPDLAPRLSRHTSEKDVFAEHRIDEQLLKALDRKVWLPSGGSLVIDRTEAMVVIDVNTGKYVGKGGNLEETVTRNNLEAAEEIARQLRLRDVGGIIVIDFIDMVLESNRDLVVRRLVECLGRDRTKHQVAEVTSLGLVQMTRKRVGQGLLEAFSEPCEACNGRGVHVHSEPVDERRGGGGGGGGGEDGRRGGRAAKAAPKPLPADAPKPGAGIAAGGEPSEDGETPAPRRRRRGGRGSGAATVAPESELQELLADSTESPAELPAPDVVPDLAEQPTPDMEDLPADASPDEVVAVVADGDLEITPHPATPAGEAPSADAHAEVDEPEDEPLAAPGADEVASAPAAPRRRRRATSRPAGPPVP